MTSVSISWRTGYQRNLVEVEPAGGSFEMDPRPARYSSKDSASVEFQRPFSLSVPFLPGHWMAPASELYVDGVPVYVQACKRDLQ